MAGYGVIISFNSCLGNFFVQAISCCEQGNTFSGLMNLENFSRDKKLLESHAGICSVESVT